jgi:zinc protease
MIVLNDILGGLFSSRINLNLREEHGYTYGARTQFIFRRLPGFFTVASGVRTDVTGPAIAEIVKELTRIRDGVTQEELALAKDAEVRSLPAEFETSGRVTSTTSNLFVYDLPLDYYAGAQRRFTSVTAAQVTAAAKKYITPETVRVVVVGDRTKVAPAIGSLNLGTMEVWSADGTGPSAR